MSFVFHRRVTWGDVDAAGIAYTGRFPQFCMEALEAWFLEVLDADWYELNVRRGIGTPFVHMDLDFRSPLTPRDALAITVRLERLGGSSLRFLVQGHANGDRLSFEGHFACAFVDGKSMKPIPVPAEFRAALESRAEPGV
ncbi:acyl-CoA thioesterase [Roseomonas sp. BN140053]|uniref:acyl-CoA thioesterase n=1 Tax=Roseomonas sp. BN140053 TaxID=3391898 RepID=UPI0039EA4E95